MGEKRKATRDAHGSLECCARRATSSLPHTLPTAHVVGRKVVVAVKVGGTNHGLRLKDVIRGVKPSVDSFCT